MSAHYSILWCREPDTRRSLAVCICRLLCKNKCACVWRKRQIKVASARSCFKIRPLAVVAASPPIVPFIAPLCRLRRPVRPEAAANRWRFSAQTHTHLFNPLAQRRLPLDWQPRLMTCICPEPSVGPIHSPACAHFPLPPANRPGRTLVSFPPAVGYWHCVSEILPQLSELFW